MRRRLVPDLVAPEGSGAQGALRVDRRLPDLQLHPPRAGADVRRQRVRAGGDLQPGAQRLPRPRLADLAALHPSFQLARAAVDEDRPGRRLDGPADHHAEHPAGIDVEPVGRLRAPATQVLELPGAVHRLHVALDLRPAEARGAVVVEADLGLDAPDLDVVLGLDERRAALFVVLERGHVVEAALPVRGGDDVLDDRPHLLEWGVDLRAGRAAKVSHAGGNPTPARPCTGPKSGPTQGDLGACARISCIRSQIARAARDLVSHARAPARAVRARRRAWRNGSGVRWGPAAASTTFTAVSRSVRHAGWTASGRAPTRVRTHAPTCSPSTCSDSQAPRRSSGQTP